eukprot:1749289-Amphidinium_carterae.5
MVRLSVFKHVFEHDFVSASHDMLPLPVPKCECGPSATSGSSCDKVRRYGSREDDLWLDDVRLVVRACIDKILSVSLLIPGR